MAATPGKQAKPVFNIPLYTAILNLAVYHLVFLLPLRQNNRHAVVSI